MSKIAGIITNSNLDAQSEMQNILHSMGLPHLSKTPNLFQFENITLGYCDSGLFCNASKTHYLLLDGVVNNGAEIKQRLLDAGQVVTSDKLEELLILAYQTWGVLSFKYLSGGFIIVIFDKNYRKIVVARDRLGSRTLFWSRTSNTFLFSSKLKGILSASIIPQIPDLSSICSYFFLGYFPQDKTPIQNITRLLPGYYIEINQDENIIIDKYWTFNSLSFDTKKYQQEEVNHKIEHYLKKACEKQRNLKGDPACLLTGDIGSAALGKLFSQTFPERKDSYSIHFQKQHLPSEAYIPKYSQAFGLKQIPHLIEPSQMLEELQQIVWHLDEPIADPLSVGIWSLGKKLQGNHKSLFSSLGCQEFLGNHMGQSTLPYEPLFLWFLYMTKPIFLKGLIPVVRKINRKVSLNALRFFQRDFWSVEHMRQQALFSERSLYKIAPKLRNLFDIDLFLQQSYQHLKFMLYQNFRVEDYLFYDAETSLSNRLIIQYENLLEPHGIEFFSPFLDFDLLKYLIEVPEPFKSRGRKGGLPLYNFLKGDLNENEIYNFQAKIPDFLAPWVKDDRLKSVFEMLTHGVLAESNIIDGNNLKKALEKKTWRVYQFERVWSILILEIWFNLFVNNPITHYPKNQPIEDFFQAQKLNFQP